MGRQEDLISISSIRRPVQEPVELSGLKPAFIKTLVRTSFIPALKELPLQTESVDEVPLASVFGVTETNAAQLLYVGYQGLLTANQGQPVSFDEFKNRYLENVSYMGTQNLLTWFLKAPNEDIKRTFSKNRQSPTSPGSQATLTPIDIRIKNLLSQGLSEKEIASRLGWSLTATERHINIIRCADPSSLPENNGNLNTQQRVLVLAEKGLFPYEIATKTKQDPGKIFEILISAINRSPNKHALNPDEKQFLDDLLEVGVDPYELANAAEVPITIVRKIFSRLIRETQLPVKI